MHTKNRRFDNLGFTIIEMAYVLVVIGIITAIAIPSFTSFLRSSRLAGSSNQLMGDMQYARTTAMSKRRQLRIEFAGTEYRIVETATAKILRTSELPSGVTCAATADPNFYPWGLADPTTVTLSAGSKSTDVALSSNGHVDHY